MEGCGSQSGLRNVAASTLAVKCGKLDSMPHPNKLVLEWMHEQHKSQAQLMRDLKLSGHQKLSMFLHGETRKPDFLYDLAVLMGRAGEGDFDRFKQGLPSRNLKSLIAAEPLQLPYAPTSKEESLRLGKADTQTIPLLEWWNLLGNTLKRHDELLDAPRASMLRSNEAGPRTKAVRVNDNSMDPELPVGHVVVFDPDAAYGDGDIVLVRMHDGTTAFRKYTALSDGSFDVHSTRPPQTWNSVKHGIVVLAPMICVYRERAFRPPEQPG